MQKILIVEDEEFLAQALKDNFESEGWMVNIAINGEEAIDRIQKKYSKHYFT